MKPTTIAERLNALILVLGHNPNSFSNAIDVIPQTTHKILKGRNNPGFEYLAKILTKFPQVNARALITGEGPLILGKNREI